MIAILQFATLVFATMFAAAAAVGFHWLLLRGTFLMMQPATAQRISSRPTDLVRGTTKLARVYAAHR